MPLHYSKPMFVPELRASRHLYERLHWYACYTHGRHERKVEAGLERVGIESYLPMWTQERKWSDRVKKIEVPLFPSYVFGRFRLIDLAAVLRTPGLATVVRSGGYPTPIPDHELEYVRRVADTSCAHGIELEADYGVEKGDRVRVVRGVFRGIEGVVLEHRSQMRVLIRLKAIQRCLAIHVPRKDLVAVT